MSINVNNNSEIEVSKSDSLGKEYDYANGLLGMERDTFLLLLRHMSFENGDSKTRNV
jgi:hypothetical protein